MKAALFLALCGLTGVAVTPAVHLPPVDGASSQLKRAARCMLRVLKSVPGIDSIELRYSDANGWSQPYLEYRARPEPDGYRATLIFFATQDFHSTDGMPFFEAIVPGVSALNEPSPPDYGAGAMAKLWEARCDVHVTVLSD